MSSGSRLDEMAGLIREMATTSWLLLGMVTLKFTEFLFSTLIGPTYGAARQCEMALTAALRMKT